MGDSGEAFPLIQGDGVMRGSFVIEGISTTRTEFFDDGAARKIEFSIKLKRVDNNDSSFGNTLLGRAQPLKTLAVEGDGRFEAIARLYRKATGELLRVTWDHSHFAVSKHIMAPDFGYWPFRSLGLFL